MHEGKQALHELLSGEADRIAGHYKVTREEALEALYGAFADRPDLLHRLHERIGDSITNTFILTAPYA
jgi:hypothetical protein